MTALLRVGTKVRTTDRGAGVHSRSPDKPEAIGTIREDAAVAARRDMARFEVIESKQWKRDDGRTASIYGAVPWVSPSEEKRWKMITRGYTVRDNERGTVGIGRQPWATRAEAQAWVDKEDARLAEARAWASKKTPAQLQQEIDDALAARRTAKRFAREDAAAAGKRKKRG